MATFQCTHHYTRRFLRGQEGATLCRHTKSCACRALNNSHHQRRGLCTSSAVILGTLSSTFTRVTLRRVKQYVIAEALGVTDELREIAERYRKEAKRALEQIASCSLVVAEAHKTCTELRGRIAASPTIDGHKQKKK